jgi:anaerobic nitric oxide reductase flavorubredoxin
LASTLPAGRFDDEVDEKILMEEAVTYYANILTPFSPLIVKKIQEVVAMGLPIDIIGPATASSGVKTR